MKVLKQVNPKSSRDMKLDSLLANEFAIPQ